MRVGAVSYLNTKPLVYRLTESAPNVELVFDLPSRLADQLARAELDVALIPSVEFFQNPEYSIVSDACIGCRGPVLSVKLLSRVPMRNIRTLALDEGSRTSAALVRILLDQRFGVRPKLLPLPIEADWRQSPADAVLVIGDRAIHADHDDLAEVWDLGDEWCRWSELSFVFAMWIARPGIELGNLAEVLSQARDRGVANLEKIAAAEGPAVGLTAEQCLSYLRDNLYFYLGPRERRGLGLYYEHTVQIGLAPAGLNLDVATGDTEAQPTSHPLSLRERARVREA